MIRSYRDGDDAEWLRMRRSLWDDCPDHQQVREMREILESDTEEVCFAERPGGGLCGFVETAIRPWAIGCDARPVGYIEGWYVDEDLRQQGAGRALVEAAESWARSKGCRQMASDAELWNDVSHQAHGAIGYRETARLVLFRKDLGQEPKGEVRPADRDPSPIEDDHRGPPMSRSVAAEIDILTGSPNWSATPDNYSSLRSVMLGRDGTGTVLYGYGQTIYAKIDCRFEVPEAGRIRFEFLTTPQLQSRPPFEPTGTNRLKEIGFTLAESERIFREDVTGSVLRFSWTLEFAEPPYPDGLSFPYSVPTLFYGYREKIGDRFTPLP